MKQNAQFVQELVTVVNVLLQLTFKELFAKTIVILGTIQMQIEFVNHAIQFVKHVPL